jgi:hypothetical protein
MGSRSWPIVLLLGLLLAVGVGAAAAIALPSEDGRPWWHDDETQYVTGAVVAVDREAGTVTLDELVTWTDPPRVEGGTPGIGTLLVEVADLGAVEVGDVADLDVTRDGGRWTAPEVIRLDTD